MNTSRSFFTWQHRALTWLLDWGVANVVVGAGLATHTAPVLRHFGLQAVSWGAIDALLALNGRRGARRQLKADITPEEEQQNARRFQTILAVNAGLDVLYILGGLWLTKSTAADGRRQGTGFGIAFQGAFLLIYDLALVWGVTRWLESHGTHPEA